MPTTSCCEPGSERDRRLEAIIGNIQKASQVGVKVITHHWTVIPIRRNARQAGRGGVTYAAFKLEENWKDLPVGTAGKVSSDDYWERITYFLHAVIPVCKQYDVEWRRTRTIRRGCRSDTRARKTGIRPRSSRATRNMRRS